jgi:hypothetical protein
MLASGWAVVLTAVAFAYVIGIVVGVLMTR